MTVLVKKGQLDYFRRRCRANPNEIMAVLVGRFIADGLLADTVRIEHPELSVSTPSKTEITGDVVSRIEADAARDGLEVLGCIHSHPNWMPVCSPADYDLFDEQWRIVGIVEVQSNRRTRVAFWTKHSSLPCDLIYKE